MLCHDMSLLFHVMSCDVFLLYISRLNTGSTRGLEEGGM